MFINSNGNLYFGDMQPGDREATPTEITSWHIPSLEGGW